MTKVDEINKKMEELAERVTTEPNKLEEILAEAESFLQGIYISETDRVARSELGSAQYYLSSLKLFAVLMNTLKGKFEKLDSEYSNFSDKLEKFEMRLDIVEEEINVKKEGK